MASWTIRFLAAAALLVAIVSYGRIRRQIAFLALRRRTGCAKPPLFPHRDPVFGYDLYRERRGALRSGGTMKLYERDFAALGKTWEEISLTKRVINTIDPVNHQHIHSTATHDFVRNTRSGSNIAVLGTGIFTAQGEQWRRSRSIIKPIFARAEVGNMAFLARHVDRFINQLPKDGSAFDLQPMAKRLALDLTTEFLLGESFGAQLGDPKASDFLLTFDEVMLGWNKRRQAGVLAARYAFEPKWPAAVQRLYGYLDGHVERALAESTSTDDAKPGSEPAADGRYVLLTEMAKAMRDPEALRFEVLNVFIPSRDTTAALFSNVFWALSRHPEHWAELRRCAQGLGLEAGAQPPAAALATLAALRPFRHIIYETLRAVGPAGRQFRVAARDTVLPRGGGPDGAAPAFVPRGATVCSVTHCIHHDRDTWGPDAAEFRPARWADADAAGATGRAPWTFVPFLGGPHVCPAQQQVVVQATYLLLRVVQAFSAIECRDDVREYVELQRMVIESRRGVQIALKP